MRALRLLHWFVGGTALVSAVAFADSDRRIFKYHDAEKARQLAQTECKPLIVHFVPNNATGGEQLNSFYAGPNAIAKSLLSKVVIVAVPTEQYRGFAKQLGVTGPGGFRTISAYDLSTLDEKSQPTCRSGFV